METRVVVLSGEKGAPGISQCRSSNEPDRSGSWRPAVVVSKVVADVEEGSFNVSL
jgi:hypothetical protein